MICFIYTGAVKDINGAAQFLLKSGCKKVSLQTQTYFRLSRFSPRARISTAGNTSAFAGYKKLGITGFCMGGSLSLAAVALVLEISAAAPFYWIPPASLAHVSTVKIRVQCNFGKLDVSNTASPQKYGELRQKLDAGGVDYEFYEYNAGHAFTNPHSSNYNKTIAELSEGRMIDFMNKHLAI